MSGGHPTLVNAVSTGPYTLWNQVGTSRGFKHSQDQLTTLKIPVLVILIHNNITELASILIRKPEEVGP